MIPFLTASWGDNRITNQTITLNSKAEISGTGQKTSLPFSYNFDLKVVRGLGTTRHTPTH